MFSFILFFVQDSLHSSFGSDVSGASFTLAFPDTENAPARGRGRGRGRGRSKSQVPTDGQDTAAAGRAPKRGRGRGGGRGRGQAQRQAEREEVASSTLTRKKEQMRVSDTSSNQQHATADGSLFSTELSKYAQLDKVGPKPFIFCSNPTTECSLSSMF